MMFRRRAMFFDSFEQWAVKPAYEVKVEERADQMNPWAATAMVARWCADATIWPTMHAIFEEWSGALLRSPTSVDIEEVVVPTLCRAFEQGRLVVVKVRPLARDKRENEEGVHGRHEPRAPSEPKPPPRRIVEPKPDLKYVYRVKVIDDTGAAVASLALKLDLEGTPRSVSTDGSGLAIVEWSSGPPATLELRDMPGVAKRMRPRWAKPRSKELPTGSNVVEVEVGSEFEPLSIACGVLTTVILARTGPRRVRMVGMVFDANKTFLLPHSLPGIRTIVAMHTERPKAKVLIVGHAEGDEALGGPDLATARAQSLGAYLTNQPDAWVDNFGAGKPVRSRWGTREVQLMLSAAPEPFYEGTASGITDKKTTQGIKAFQRSKKLSADGKVSKATLKALIESYMSLQDTSLAADIAPVTHGCQGHFDDDLTDDGLEPDDRRIEVFFFNDEILPAPPGNVSGPGSAAYPAWRRDLVETRDFEIHGIHVQIVDTKKQPVPFADAVLEGPTSGSARADRHGFVSFFDLVAGAYTLRATKAGSKIGTFKLKYPTAKTEPGQVRATKDAAQKSGGAP